MKELVSIIVAVYNAEKDLERCIASICSQTYVNIQIILVDDGSTDHSPEICDEWAKKDSRILTKHLSNKGVSGARNEGIRCAGGSYITFVDSDDWVEDNFVETLIRTHKKDSFTCCGYIVERITAKKDVRRRLIRCSDEDKNVIPRQNVVSLYTSELFSTVWNKLYESECIRKNAIQFPSGYSLGEDFIFNIQYLSVLQGDIMVSNSLCYHYVVKDEASLSRKYYKDFYDIQKTIFEKLLSYLNQVMAEEEQILLARQLYINALIVSFDNLYRNKKNMSDKSYREHYKKLIQQKEIPELISEMHGMNKFFPFIRWQLICHGLFPLEFHLRTLIKKLLRLE